MSLVVEASLGAFISEKDDDDDFSLLILMSAFVLCDADFSPFSGDADASFEDTVGITGSATGCIGAVADVFSAVLASVLMLEADADDETEIDTELVFAGLYVGSVNGFASTDVSRERNIVYSNT